MYIDSMLKKICRVPAIIMFSLFLYSMICKIGLSWVYSIHVCFLINTTAATLYSQNKIGCMRIILCTDSFSYFSLMAVDVRSTLSR